MSSSLFPGSKCGDHSQTHPFPGTAQLDPTCHIPSVKWHCVQLSRGIPVAACSALEVDIYSSVLPSGHIRTKPKATPLLSFIPCMRYYKEKSNIFLGRTWFWEGIGIKNIVGKITWLFQIFSGVQFQTILKWGQVKSLGCCFVLCKTFCELNLKSSKQFQTKTVILRNCSRCSVMISKWNSSTFQFETFVFVLRFSCLQ